VTAIVGIRCKDGVVIGSDSSATFGDGIGRGVIEQLTNRKIQIIGEGIIVAGTGAVGHMQRFCAVIQTLWNQKAFQNKTDIEVGKMLASSGIADFAQTHAMNNLQFAALVAYPAMDQPSLCELPGGPGIFQPEIKKVDDLWFASSGNNTRRLSLSVRVYARSAGCRSLRHDILRALVVNLAHFMSRDLRCAGLRYVLRSHGVAVGNDLEARRERPEMFTCRRVGAEADDTEGASVKIVGRRR